MPRANKAIKRQRVNAGEEYKKGKRKEAYDMWAAAAKSRAELAARKRNRKKAAEDKSA